MKDQTDRELLEAAAKAAGNGAVWYVGLGMGIGPVSAPSIDALMPKLWNPLTDDGDALRLAVKMRLDFVFPPRSGTVIACRGKAGARESVDYVDDPYAATRRAIVRAAASIGATK